MRQGQGRLGQPRTSCRVGEPNGHQPRGRERADCPYERRSEVPRKRRVHEAGVETARSQSTEALSGVREMTFFMRKRVVNSGANKYAGVEDFRQVFSDDRDVLHRLALLLTGDKEKAEQCFVAGLEDSVNTNGVFKAWARTWAKRVIIQNAISILKPGPGQHAVSSPENVAQSDVRQLSIPDRDVVISSVLALEDFSRFVFVITALEGY